MPTPPCLLARVPNGANEFTATAGALTLVLHDIAGQTHLNTLATSVFDITDPGMHIAVHASLTPTSLSVQLESGKRYFIAPAFVQILAPFSSQAAWKEACGQQIDTITVTNLFPGYIVGVA